MYLLLTREESGVSKSGFCKKNSASQSFLVKSLMSFSISGKLRCRFGVNIKSLLKIWICEGIKVTLDKFRTLGWIISSFFGWILLLLGHVVKNYLLWNCSHFLRLGSNILCIWYNDLCSFCWSLYWSRFHHSF